MRAGCLLALFMVMVWPLLILFAPISLASIIVFVVFFLYVNRKSVFPR